MSLKFFIKVLCIGVTTMGVGIGNVMADWCKPEDWDPAVLNTAQTRLKIDGDDYYTGWICLQPIIHKFWYDFNFYEPEHGDSWDGYGYEDPCNPLRPLARTFNALRTLLDTPTYYKFAFDRIHALEFKCWGEGRFAGANAVTFHGGTDNRTEVYYPFIYSEPVPERGGTLVHEARHVDNYPHNEPCPHLARLHEGNVCDPSWDYHGTYYYEVHFLADYWVADTIGPPALHTRALMKANAILWYRFAKDPGFSLTGVYCKDNEITNWWQEFSCVPCAEGTVPSNRRNACMPCPQQGYGASNGRCYPCQPNQLIEIKEVPSYQNSRQPLFVDGTICGQICPTGMVANQSRDQCVSCPTPLVPSPDGSSCTQPPPRSCPPKGVSSDPYCNPMKRDESQPSGSLKEKIIWFFRH